MKKLPPYGKKLMEVTGHPDRWTDFHGTSADGKHLTIWIAIGKDAWDWTRDRSKNMLIAVIPLEESPGNLNLSFVKGHDPILVNQCGHSPTDFVLCVVSTLIRDGAQRVLVFGENGTTLYRDSSYA